MTTIEGLAIRKILDSRGDPTVEVDVRTASGVGRAAAPSGASTGSNEIQALPRRGVQEALEVFQDEVAPRILHMDAQRQGDIDATLHAVDGTPNFARIGGNVATATSLACAKAAAQALGVPLYFYLGGASARAIPSPMGNIIGGGRHAVGGTTIQEFLAVALGPRATEAVFANALVHRRVKEILQGRLRDQPLGRGDEGAWIAPLNDEEALGILVDACAYVSKEVGFRCRPGLDLAASEFFRQGGYHYRSGTKTRDQQVEFVAHLVEEYDLYSVEDPLDQEDFEGYARLTELVGRRCLIVGDDLFVTNTKRIERGIAQGACNAVLIKPNQVGTLTDTLAAVRLAHAHGYRTIISHRSGETTDESIAHLGVSFGCTAIKTGTVGGERIAKLNELIRIEEGM